MAADQYDKIGADYAAMEKLPGELVATNHLTRHLKQLPHDLRVLDLPVGTGTYARLALDLGVARHVTGVDISSEMLRVGRELEQQQRPDAPKIDFHLGDCFEPLDRLGLEPNSFDLVLANYLFNYATTRKQLEAMWHNVVTYLKPGGKLVGLLPTFDVQKHLRRSAWNGITYKHLEDLDEAVRVQLTFHCEPQIQFDNYVLPAEAYEHVPLEVGMRDVVFNPPTEEDIPPVEDAAEAEKFKHYLTESVSTVLVATKGS